ncbi:hypothetical protein B0T24DRAFT_642950 [Lasiosphaeria ovina]|uniref:Uncharacterized protein n=1 Tax=Lasiosphaeria ovina TaxID=92902 RepID=A0AAE0JUD8_9PEZI|nr:hypothetical protein B0T24DRAFT_642950 [Lasiosphaeria ovina]
MEPPGMRLRRLEKPLERYSKNLMGTNIHRDAWQVGGSLFSAEKGPPRIPAALEEKATIFRETRGGTEFVIILTDPLPELKRPEEGRPISRRGANQQPKPPRTYLPYEYFAARWTYQPERGARQSDTRDHPDRPRNAHVDMLSWMTNQCLRGPPGLLMEPASLTLSNPIEASFRVVFFDTMALCDVFDNVLHEIWLASLEDSELESSIGIWRQMLTQAQLRLPTLLDTIDGMAGTGFHQSASTTSNLSPDSLVLVGRVRQRISAVTKRVEEINATFQAELSVLVSRKQLLESSSVTRLTELAFVFIPLSFAASAFSMQIQELQSPPPLTTFILAASLTMCVAYLVRISVSDRVFGRISRHTERAARRYGEVPDGRSVPKGTYVYVTFRTCLSYIASTSGVVLACVGALAWLWARSGLADSGLKAVLTAVVVLVLSLSAALPATEDDTMSWLESFWVGLARQRQQRRRRRR